MPPAEATLAALRRDVRSFLDDWDFEPRCDSWIRSADPEFSAELGRRGWIGMTIPEAYGGRGRTYVERYVVTQELLRAGAPVAAHWFADRQIGPTLIAEAGTRLQEQLLPGICRGETYFAIGMSEPGAGSDLTSIATRAAPDGSDWIINGQKVWTTGASIADYCYLIARTDRVPGRPHQGLSEFVVPMDAEGLTVRPIADLSGQTHFAELFFDDVRVADWRMVGDAGGAFARVVQQLDYERSGPERFLSSYPLFEAVLRIGGAHPGEEWLTTMGELAARYAGLQAMSVSIARATDRGRPPSAYAALVKEMGASLEQELVGIVEDLVSDGGLDTDDASAAALYARLREAQVSAPTYTIRGGTTEILREIVARRMLELERSA